MVQEKEFQVELPLRWLGFNCKRVLVLSPAGCFIDSVRHRSENGRERRFAQAGWVDIIFNEVHINAFGSFVVANDAIIMEIALFGCAILVG